MAKEITVERDAVEWMRAQGAYVSKNPGSFLTGRGLPDRFVCYRGHFIALEFKSPEKKLDQAYCTPLITNDRFATPTQQMHLQQVREAGGRAYTVNTMDAVRALFARIESEDATYAASGRSLP